MHADSRRPLVVGFVVFLLVSIASATIAVIALHVVGAGVSRVALRYTDRTLAVERVRFQAERVVTTARGYLLTRASAQLARLEDAVAALDTRVRELRESGPSPDSNADLSAIVEAAHAYEETANTLAHEDTPDIAKAFDEMLRPRREELQHHVDLLGRRERAAFEAALERARERAERAAAMVAVAGVTGVIASLLIAFAVARRSSRLYGDQRRALDDARRSAAARKEVLAVVSHDLRDPLSTVSMAGELIAAKLGDAEHADARRHAATIRAATTRMQHLVEQILDAARADDGTLQLAIHTCDVQSLLASAVDLFRDRSERESISLRCEAPAAPLAIGCDNERVLQVLCNLISNALRFTPSGGSVVVGATVAAASVEFSVDDTGPGISSAEIPHLFDRYWQGDRPSGARGLGLGLYICKQVVEAHGGRIWVVPGRERGSSFRFTLPRDTGPAPVLLA